ncbi:MAG: o-succinylbenzoate--CoA ligase [Candidatus Hydrogenedentes bacterium]|nr:o-succinylbenzoate--CoA ligase [Candidatus Hydrogenedentota bacterium]
MPDRLEQIARQYAGHPAVIGPEGSVSFDEWWGRAGSVAAGLERAGVRPGGRVAVLLPNGIEHAAVLLGCLRLGAAACPVDMRLPAQGVAGALRQLGPAALVTGGSESAPGYGGIPHVAVADLMKAAAGWAGSEPAHEDERPATVVFTSGSSGEPKPAVLTLGSHWANAAASNANIPVRPGDCWLLSLPFHHVSGQGTLFRCMLGGGAVGVPTPGQDLAEAIRHCGATHVSLVATQLGRLLASDAGRSALQGLKAVLLGGSAIPEPLIREAVACRVPIHTTYGLTETASQVTTTEPGAGLDTLLTSGRPLTRGTVRIADDGEILVRGDTLFAGYLRNGRIEPPVLHGGWFATGDLGSMDEAGRLGVSGRRDSRFVSGGENIQPEEIERHLCAVSGVIEAVVVPVADDEYGARPAAFIRTERPVSGEALAARLAERLPRFKIPVRFLPWPEEAGARMKVDRRRLAGMLREKP